MKRVAILALLGACCAPVYTGSEGGDGQGADLGSNDESAGEECPYQERFGDIAMVGPDADLSTLEGVTHVFGTLRVQSVPVESLEVLHCLERVDELWIGQADRLESLDGLQNLSEAQVIGISDAMRLTTLEGLAPSLELEELQIDGTGLVSLDGLVRGTIHKVNVLHSDHLADVCALSGIGGIDVLQFHSLPSLVSVACLADAEKWWQGSGSWENVLHVDGNERLTALTGIPIRGSFLGAIIVEDNPALVDLHGLERLERVGSLTIAGNDGLQSLAHVDPTRQGSLRGIPHQMFINANEALGDCEIDQFLVSLEQSDGVGAVSRAGNKVDECTANERR